MEALAYPEFRRFWTASAVSNAGSLVHLTAIGWAVEILTDDPLKVTLTATAGLVPLVLLSPYAGTLADRFPRRSVMLGSVTAQTIVAFGWALLFSLTDVNYTTLFLFSLFGGIANSLGQPVQQVIAVDLVPPEGMRNAITLNSVQWNVARALGPLIAGVLIDQFSVAAAFWVNAVSYGAMIIMLLRIQHRPATGGNRDWRAEFRAGLSYVRDYRPLAVALSFGAMVAVMLGPAQNLVPVIARDGFEVGAGKFGILAAAFGVGSVVGGILVLPTEHRFRHSQLVGGGLAFMSVAMFALAIAPQFWFGVVAMFFIGVGFVASTSNLVSAMQALSSDEYRGRVMSLWLMAFGLASPFSVVAQGAAAKYFGIRWAVGGTAVVGMLAYLYGTTTGLIREIDPSPSSDDTGSPDPTDENSL